MMVIVCVRRHIDGLSLTLTTSTNIKKTLKSIAKSDQYSHHIDAVRKVHTQDFLQDFLTATLVLLAPCRSLSHNGPRLISFQNENSFSVRRLLLDIIHRISLALQATHYTSIGREPITH
jgi:hypothetical protein